MEQIATFKDIQTAFVNGYIAYKTQSRILEEKMGQRKKQLERLETRYDALFLKNPTWVNALLYPVLAIIKQQMKGWVCDDERLCPLGLGCRVSVFFFREGMAEAADNLSPENSVYIVFLPGDLDKGELLYETGKWINRYPTGSLGEINGFNNVTKPLESVEEAVQFLLSQIQ